MRTPSLERILDAARQSASAVTMGARLTRDVPAFLREPITLEDSVRWQRDRLATREDVLLRVAERQIYPFPGSPYRALLRAAGCELGDLRVLVQHEGVEGALERLVQLGVYVTYEELKGRREAVRSSQRFSFREADFDNPLVTPHYQVLSGGTGGRRSQVSRSLPFLVETAYCIAVALDAHQMLHTRQAFWATGPVNLLLRYPKLGVPLGAWFYPLSPLPWKVRLGGIYLSLLGRLAGRPLPIPIYGDLQAPQRVLSWLLKWRRREGRVCLMTTVSSAVRLASLATATGYSLDGVTFFVRSEPLTEAKQQTLDASGARTFTNYGLMEAPMIAISCATPTAPDDAHVFDSRHALVQRRRPAYPDGPELDVLAVTTLSEHAPKTLLNVETGDYADLARRDCGCKLGALGLRTHLSNIRSFEKLTGEGMTFARTNLMHVVEAILPARFGGTSVDYQVVEEERPDGLPRLVLRVSPSVGDLDEGTLRATFLEALARDGDLERYMAAFWKRANTIEVERQAPRVTPAGKVLPFQLVRAGSPEPHRQG